jgi:hypothetical protein
VHPQAKPRPATRAPLPAGASQRDAIRLKLAGLHFVVGER